MSSKYRRKAPKEQGITVLIPQGIDLSSLPNTYTRNLKRGEDKLAYFLSQFVRKNKRKGQSITEPIDLPSAWLERVLGKEYYLVLNGLLEADVIVPVLEEFTYYQNGFKEQRVRAYSVTNKQCKRYKLNVPPNAALRRYRITDRRFTQDIHRTRIKETEEVTSRNLTARRLFESLKKLTIDTTAAKTYINRQYKLNELIATVRWLLTQLSGREIKSMLTGVSSTKKKLEKQRVIKNFGIKDTQRVLDAIKSHQKILTRMACVEIVDQIQKGNHDLISITEDRKTGRLYHTFTSSPRDLRQFMRLEGQSVLELDASNCQWHVFLGFLRDFLSFSGKKYPNSKENNPHNQQLLFNMFPVLTFSLKSELEVEIERLENELIQKQFRKRMAQKLGVDPNKAKNELIGNVFFGKPDKGDYNNWPSVVAFREDYPVLFEVITKLKTEWLNEAQFDYTPQERYKALPVLLQKLEAEIFIKGMEECPGAFLTCHDAVWTNENSLSVVADHLQHSIRNSGYNLKLK